MSANERQVGGAHYQKGGSYQHWDLMADTVGIGYHMANATKYLGRWRDKNGLEDVRKAGHYVQKCIELAEAGHTNPVDPLTAISKVNKYFETNGIDPGSPEGVIIDMVLRWHEVVTLRMASQLIELMLVEENGTP